MSNLYKFNNKDLSASSFFSNWAEVGKDVGMEKSHADSIGFMFNQLEPYFSNSFSTLGAGCGKGWAV
jgi:hypothetical protein